jgi:hypothetical protein
MTRGPDDEGEPMTPEEEAALAQRIRERAYRLWEEEGRPPGRALDHWDRARTLIAIEDNPGAALEPNPVGSDAPPIPGEPVEPLIAVENQGEFPTLTDQGEESTAPKRRGPRRAAPRRKPGQGEP